MNAEDLKGKLVGVLGYGLEGRAVTEYLLKNGIKPVVFDQKPLQEFPAQQQQELKNLNLNLILGPNCFEELRGFDVAFRSPGVKLKQILNLGFKNLRITSQTKWFFEHCPAKIVGVTGTKGKGTTSTLIANILQRNSETLKLSYKIYLTGNIGKIQPLDILDNLTAEDFVVYELSSFQLQDLTQSPQFAAVLMVTSEHLDYHENEQEYVDAKSAITKFQKPGDFAVVNSDFDNSVEIGKLGSAQKLYFSTRFEQGDAYVKEGQIFIRWEKFAPAELFLDTSRLQLPGRHNWENVCAAILSAFSAGAGREAIRQAVLDFKGLEHRLEYVVEKQGVKFYNDSFSTTPETAIAAIQSFEAPLIAILGGSSKNSDFAELGKVITGRKNIKTLILVGEEGDRIKKSIENAGGFSGQILEGASSMDEIYNQIKSAAAAGDIVLMSPACASFGMFKNYIDRGLQFKEKALSY